MCFTTTRVPRFACPCGRMSCGVACVLVLAADKVLMLGYVAMSEPPQPKTRVSNKPPTHSTPHGSVIRCCPDVAGAYATKILCVLGLVCNGIFACLALELQAGLGDVDREGGALRHHRRRASQAELLGNAGKAGAEIATTSRRRHGSKVREPENRRFDLVYVDPCLNCKSHDTLDERNSGHFVQSQSSSARSPPLSERHRA